VDLGILAEVPAHPEVDLWIIFFAPMRLRATTFRQILMVMMVFHEPSGPGSRMKDFGRAFNSVTSNLTAFPDWGLAFRFVEYLRHRTCLKLPEMAAH
jgi:hypothetical protein